MRVAILDYGVGNLRSLAHALAAAGATATVEGEARRALRADLLVLPGVGAFGAASRAMEPHRAALVEAAAAGHRVLGICLGMQLLFEGSEEGEGRGLGLLPGRVRRLRGARVPHMGWAALEGGAEPLVGAGGLEVAYFAHGFVCDAGDPDCVTAWAVHEGERFAAVVRSGSVVGAQFHPEKSSRAGVGFLRGLLQEVGR
jgi:imidazole glycerol-phosphate synthase subunit HisH